MPNECLNCEFLITAGAKFCPECGQRTNIHRLSFHEISHDAMHYFTHADKSVFRLLRDLVLRTGSVAREYVAGKRKKHFPPLNFYLLVATVFVLIISIASTSYSSANVLKDHPEISRIPDKAEREKMVRIYERQAVAINFINKYSNILAMIALPLICLIYWLFYIKARYNYTEHLVACMYMAGFTNLVYAVIFVPLSVVANLKFKGPASTILIFYIVFQVAYGAVFYYHFINKRTTGSAIKATLISLFAVLFWFALSGLSVGFYIANGL